jgi:ElaB/YqjD/DUF883 family membrane-anchored ribosome-binding protein
MGTQSGAISRPQSSEPASGTERIQEAASGLIEQAGSTAEAHASRTMTQAGDTLHQVAQAIREAGNGIQQDQPQLAGFADTAAEQMDHSAAYLREHDATEVVNAATDFARRQPAVVVGGGLLIGLAVGRFLRTASEAATSEFQRGATSGYDRYGTKTSRTYEAGHPTPGAGVPAGSVTLPPRADEGSGSRTHSSVAGPGTTPGGGARTASEMDASSERSETKGTGSSRQNGGS